MPLPPVVARIRSKRVSDAELRAFVEKAFPAAEYRMGFEELHGRFLDAAATAAIRFVALPEDDPYWESAPRDQNLLPALRSYLLDLWRRNPDAEAVAWTLAALAVGYGHEDDFGREYWMPLVRRDPRNIRWAVESAVTVSRSTGAETTRGLFEFMVELGRDPKGLFRILQGLCDDPEPRLAAAARVALGVAEGEKLLPAWRRQSGGQTRS